jgi:hypothetical protein
VAGNPAIGKAIKIPAQTGVKMRVAKAEKDSIVPPTRSLETGAFLHAPVCQRPFPSGLICIRLGKEFKRGIKKFPQLLILALSVGLYRGFSSNTC